MDAVFSGLNLDPTSEVSYVGQIRVQVTLLIVDGKLPSGSRLPPVRVLADHLGVNANTIRAAYSRLEADGVVATRHGVGTTVLPPTSTTTALGLPGPMTNSVGVIIAGLDPFYLPLLQGLEAEADETGTLLFIIDVRDSEERAAAAVRQLAARGANGVIAVSIGGPAEGSTTGPMPLVSVDQPDRAGHSLMFDAEQAGYDATTHLVAHGHDRVGLVTCPVDWPNQRDLFRGYQRALHDSGVDPDPDLVATVPSFALESGQAGARSLLDDAVRPTAVLASGGMLALGVLREARLRQLSPTELAIIGYGDLEVAALSDPALTMVTLPSFEMGVAAMRALKRAMADGALKPIHTVMRGSLTERASCGRHDAARVERAAGEAASIAGSGR